MPSEEGFADKYEREAITEIRETLENFKDDPTRFVNSIIQQILDNNKGYGVNIIPIALEDFVKYDLRVVADDTSTIKYLITGCDVEALEHFSEKCEDLEREGNLYEAIKPFQAIVNGELSKLNLKVKVKIKPKESKPKKVLFNNDSHNEDGSIFREKGNHPSRNPNTKSFEALKTEHLMTRS
ncbi:MAG: hypothetical protein ACJAW3_001601 [Lentimonas sp.]|jgi:hypothetical protein